MGSTENMYDMGMRRMVLSWIEVSCTNTIP